jgi:hypothetical protein
MAKKNFSIETSPLWNDITKVMGSPTKNTFASYTATIHTEFEDYPALYIEQIDISRDYEYNIGDITFVTFNLSFGDYVRRFYPFINNLEITITKSYLYKASTTADSKNTIQKQRYKAVFLPHDNPHVDLSEFQSMDKTTLDHLNIVTVKIQLLSRVLEPMRISFTQGIYPKVRQETVLRAEFAKLSKNILVDGKPCLDALNLYPPDNTDIQKHIIIPNNTLSVSLPTFLQEKMNGVYSSGIGSYLQYYQSKNTWFIYPLYNTDRYKKDPTNGSKVIFYFVPAYRYGGIDNTYYVDGQKISILCTGDKKLVDDGDTRYMDQGVGFVQADARAYMAKPVVMKDSGPQGNPARLTTFAANTSRSDGLNYAPSTEEGISSNPFKQYSLIAKRNVTAIQVTWEHSDNTIIYPGMPCHFVYLEDGQRKTIDGIIAKVQSFIYKTNKGALTPMYIESTTLIIYAQRKPKQTTVPQDVASPSLTVTPKP